MSKSFYHNNIHGNCTTRPGHEAQAKCQARKALRRANKTLLTSSEDLFEILPKVPNEVSDVWCFPKDGKRFFRDPAFLRK